MIKQQLYILLKNFKIVG